MAQCKAEKDSPQVSHGYPNQARNRPHTTLTFGPEDAMVKPRLDFKWYIWGAEGMRRRMVRGASLRRAEDAPPTRDGRRGVGE